MTFFAEFSEEEQLNFGKYINEWIQFAIDYLEN